MTQARLREDLIHPDPLLDCLVEVCRLHGQAASRATLSAGMPLVGGRMTLELAERAVARAGMATKLQRLALDQTLARLGDGGRGPCPGRGAVR